MKSLVQKLSLVTAALFAVGTSIPDAQAANLTLDGFGYYDIQNRVRFFPGGAKQGGRYRNLGADYYHKTTIEMDFITNRSYSRSGSMSFEFWAMPYYDANKGIILMTRGIGALGSRGSVVGADKTGYAVSLNARRFPELNLWEYTRSGWRFRDSLTFTRKTYL